MNFAAEKQEIFSEIETYFFLEKKMKFYRGYDTIIVNNGTEEVLV